MKETGHISNTHDGLKLFVVLVAVLSVALCATIVIDNDSTANDDSNGIMVNGYVDIGDLNYYLTGDDAHVHKVSDEGINKKEIVIPDTISYDGKEYKVTAIDRDAFSYVDRQNFTKITIGDNVKVIRETAFQSYTKMKEIVFGKGVEEICGDAFSKCTGLKNVTLGDNVRTIGDGAFSGCSNLKTLTIPENVQNIGYYAFSYCHNLTTVNFNAKNVNNGLVFAFQSSGTRQLTVNFGDNVEMIPAHLFEDNKNLRKITKNPNTSVGDYAFNRCMNLKTVEDRTVETDGDLSSSNQKPTIGCSAYEGCYIKRIAIHKHTHSIGDRAFYGNKELNMVVIPGSVETIGNKAFGDCPNIDKFAFGDFDDDVEFGEHIFSYEDESNGTVDYKFRNMDGKEYTFTDANVESGVFDNRAYDVDENGKAVNVFALLLDANGGTCDDSIAFTDENGILVEALPTPTREGYVFNGWYDGDEKVGVGSVFTENTTLTAKWVVAQPAGGSAPLLILLLLAIIAIVGIAVIPKKE